VKITSAIADRRTHEGDKTGQNKTMTMVHPNCSIMP